MGRDEKTRSVGTGNRPNRPNRQRVKRESTTKRQRIKKEIPSPIPATLRQRAHPHSRTGPLSIKELEVDLARLERSWLGKIIPPKGGQVKRAVMDLANATALPIRFSRMSGIQEWRNTIMLFVNVYGDEYKNVFLGGGRLVTWFAQRRQWEGTPVIQRLIHSDGATVTFEEETTCSDDSIKEVKAASQTNIVEYERTPVLLFCRNKGFGYCYCGELGYLGHDPTQLPIRFVWELLDFEVLRFAEPFRALLCSCENLVPGSANQVLLKSETINGGTRSC